MKVTIAQMKKLGWASITQKSVDELNVGITKFKIASVNELCHFLSQLSHESGCGRWPTEIWGPSKAQLTYEGRVSLGNIQPGDGFKFRGAGWIQTTGRHNYTAFSKYVGDPKIVELGAEYLGSKYPWTSSFYWWMNNNMSKLCSTNPTVSTVTKRVNGGQNGLVERESYYAKCKIIFTDESVNGPAPIPSSTPKKAVMPMVERDSPNNDKVIVKTLQKALKARGFDCGYIDGVFGIKTDKAVRAFQTKLGLRVDGVVGPKTWAALGF